MLRFKTMSRSLQLPAHAGIRFLTKTIKKTAQSGIGVFRGVSNRTSPLLTLLIVLAGHNSSASIVQSFYFKGELKPEIVQHWNSLGTKNDYSLDLGDPAWWDIEELDRFNNFKQLYVVLRKYPLADTEKYWIPIAKKNTTLVSFDYGLPTPHEIERLNRIGFKKIIIVLSSIPRKESAENLKKLNGELSITFSLSRYPFFHEADALKAIPKDVVFTFSTDYWPGEWHRDTFNELPQVDLRLRIYNILPSDGAFEKMHQIKALKQVSLHNDWSISEKLWPKFKGLQVQWTSQDWVPSMKSLQGFATGRKDAVFTIDQDRDLSRSEKNRLNAIGMTVRWLRSAPMP